VSIIWLFFLLLIILFVIERRTSADKGFHSHFSAAQETCRCESPHRLSSFTKKNWGTHFKALYAHSNFLAVCKALTTLVHCSNGNLSHNNKDVVESIITCISDMASAAVDACSVAA
jgi:hypothetical protein